MKHIPIAVFTVVLVGLSASALGADDFAKGHGALEVFDGEGISAAPLWVKVWVGFMMLMFASGLIFVKSHAEARWASGGFLAGAVSGGYIFAALGLPFLSGALAIVHLLFWSPALFLLLSRRPFLNEEKSMPFRIWAALMTATIIFSFIFDIRDAYIYISHFSGTA